MASQSKLKATKVSASLLVGAFIGAAIFLVQYQIGLYEVNGAEHFKEWAVSKGIRVFIPAFIVWLIALCVFGGPIWAVLHMQRRTNWYFALSAGFIVPFIVILVTGTGYFTGNSGYTTFYANGGDQVIDGKLTPFGWKMALFTAFEYAGVGTVISLTIWWMNYRTKRA